MAQPYTRIVNPRLCALLVASAALFGLTWIDWWFARDAWFGVPYPFIVSAALVATVVITVRWSACKRAIVAAFQKHILNSPVRILLRLGLSLGWSLVETTGRNSKRPRVVPVGNGLVGSRFWIVAEHGTDAAYVRNLSADPRVRVRLRHGWSMAWRTGTAHVLADDDPYARQRWLIGSR